MRPIPALALITVLIGACGLLVSACSGEGDALAANGAEPSVALSDMTVPQTTVSIVETTTVRTQPVEGALELPDRMADAVRSEEARIITLLKTTPDVSLPGDCDVRLLGQDESASFVWAYCSDGVSGASVPLRIDGDKVSIPGDGESYPIDVKRMFPPDLADAILDHDERLRPEESQTSTIPCC